MSMESNEIEQDKLSLMRSFVETQDPTSKEFDDLILIRFLRVRKLDVDKASDSFLKYLKWRQAVAPNGYISESQVSNELSQKKLFIQGFDKKGRPIAVLFSRRHVPVQGKESLHELKRFIVYCIDKLYARMPNGQDQFTTIVDLAGWGFSSFDYNGGVATLSILQDYFPERLGQVYLLNQTYIFTTLWKIISQFIRTNTRKKIVFVENKKVTSRLLEDIDESQLPEIYGGKLPLTPIEDS